ncbi:hypothetical protein IAT38_001984 [Cryptococcus sp. DSM 104549]
MPTAYPLPSGATDHKTLPPQTHAVVSEISASSIIKAVWNKEEYPGEAWGRSVAISAGVGLMLVAVIMGTGIFEWMFQESGSTRIIVGQVSYAILTGLNIAALWLARSMLEGSVILTPFGENEVLPAGTLRSVCHRRLANELPSPLPVVFAMVAGPVAIMDQFFQFTSACGLAIRHGRKNGQAGEQKQQSGDAVGV